MAEAINKLLDAMWSQSESRKMLKEKLIEWKWCDFIFEIMAYDKMCDFVKLSAKLIFLKIEWEKF